MKKWILSLAVASIVLSGCGDDKKNMASSTEQKAPATVTENKVTAPLEKAKTEIVEAAVAVEKNSKELVQEVKQEAQVKDQEIKEEATKAAKEVTQAVENKVEEATAIVEEAAGIVNTKGIELYAKCAACHGSQGEKKALGNSMIIKGWSVEQTASSLKGYKNKTYGGSMKTIMMSQVATLSDEDIQALAEHIAGF